LNGAGRDHPVADYPQDNARHHADDDRLLVRLVVLGEQLLKGVNAAKETDDGVQNARRLKRMNDNLDQPKKACQATNDH
jgi:hypothetical protein